MLNVITWQFEHMHASSETPEMMILIVNRANTSKLNNDNFFKFGYIIGSRVFLKYIDWKNGVTVFVYKKMSIHFSEERVLV